MWSSFGRTVAGKAIREKFYWSTIGQKFLVGNSCTVRKMRMTSNWQERNKILIRCEKFSIIKLICENPHHSMIMFTWDALKDNVKQAKILLTITEPCSNPELSQEHWKKYGARKQ